MAYQTPKTDWKSSNVVQPADMNRIEQNTVELKKAATIDVADANNYFTTTPKTVESALQELGSAVTAGKNSIASAITSMGQSTSGTDTFATLASKIQAISTDATAGTGDVLSGKTFYQGGSKKTGTMPNNGAVIITPSTQNQTIAQGYHNGSGYVKGDANLVASNIRRGVGIFGVQGSAPAGNILFAQKGTKQYYATVGWEAGYADVATYQEISNGIIFLSVGREGSDVAYTTSTAVDLTGVNYISAVGINWDGYARLLVDTQKIAPYTSCIAAVDSISTTDKYQGLLLNVSSLSGVYYVRLHVYREGSYWWFMSVSMG